MAQVWFSQIYKTIYNTIDENVLFNVHLKASLQKRQFKQHTCSMNAMADKTSKKYKQSTVEKTAKTNIHWDPNNTRFTF